MDPLKFFRVLQVDLVLIILCLTLEKLTMLKCHQIAHWHLRVDGHPHKIGLIFDLSCLIFLILELKMSIVDEHGKVLAFQVGWIPRLNVNIQDLLLDILG